MTRVIATIEARMTSSRLPGKVLLPALGEPMLAHLVRRLKAVPSIDGIVLATTTNATDDVLEEFARSQKIDCFRGSEEDVMERVIGAATHGKADIVVEITGDCPIIDPMLIQQAIQLFRSSQPCDYCSNGHIRSYPDGMDVQVFPLETLRKSASMTKDPLDHEHVTLHIRNHPEIFRHKHMVAPKELHWPELGLTLDEPKDYELITRLLEHFGREKLFSCAEAIALLKAHPEWIVNSQVHRKGDT